MLDYLGPNVGGNGPITAQLPPAVAGTMPQGVPNIPRAGAIPPPMPLHAAHPANAIHGHAANPAAMAAILHSALGGLPGQPRQEYMTTTQDDGSILLHMRNADGLPGVVVKVIPPIKRPA